MSAEKPALTAPRTSDEWRAFFRERGWTITMDDRPGQAFDPFVHVADAVRSDRDELDVERLARAIWQVEANKPGSQRGWTWDRFDGEAKDIFRGEARDLAAEYRRLSSQGTT